MTRIKLCGMKRLKDIEYANSLKPDYVGLVFAKNSKRYVTRDDADRMKMSLDKSIKAVGVFVDEPLENVIEIINGGVVDVVQLHGLEDDNYIKELKSRCECQIIKAFCVKEKSDIEAANASSADYVLLDSGAGCGVCFDWSLLDEIKRAYFLAGGLDSYNVRAAIEVLKPFCVDASSSLETDGVKDEKKMAAFVGTVRESEEEVYE